MLVKVLKSFTQAICIWFLYIIKRHATVHLQALRSSHYHREFRIEARHTAFNVKKLLCTKVCTKSCLSYDIVAKCHSRTCSNNGVTSMGYICKRTTMHESRSILRCLYQVRVQRLHKQSAYTTPYAHIPHCKGRSVVANAKQYVVNAATQVIHIFCKTQNSHNLRRRCYVETTFHRDAIGTRTYTCNYIAQIAIIHIHGAFP